MDTFQMTHSLKSHSLTLISEPFPRDLSDLSPPHVNSHVWTMNHLCHDIWLELTSHKVMKDEVSLHKVKQLGNMLLIYQHNDDGLCTDTLQNELDDHR